MQNPPSARPATRSDRPLGDPDVGLAPARSLWRSVRLLQQRPRDKRGELISDDDALILRGVLRELALELGVSPLVEPHRAGAAPWKWIAAGDGEQMARRN